MSNTSPESAGTIAEEIASECIGVRTRMLARAVSRIYDDALRALDLRFSQMNILTVVARHGPVQPVEVSKMLALEKSTLSRNLRIMESNGWIAVRPAPTGNARLLTLTSAGRRLLSSAAPAWRMAQEEVQALLGEPTARALHRAAGRLTIHGPD